MCSPCQPQFVCFCGGTYFFLFQTESSSYDYDTNVIIPHEKKRELYYHHPTKLPKGKYMSTHIWPPHTPRQRNSTTTRCELKRTPEDGHKETFLGLSRRCKWWSSNGEKLVQMGRAVLIGLDCVDSRDCEALYGAAGPVCTGPVLCKLDRGALIDISRRACVCVGTRPAKWHVKNPRPGRISWP